MLKFGDYRQLVQLHGDRVLVALHVQTVAVHRGAPRYEPNLGMVRGVEEISGTHNGPAAMASDPRG